MKAISLHQPWASLLAAGIKPHETRSWCPPARLIGERIAIAAAKRPPQPAEFSPELIAVIAQAGGLRQLIRRQPGAGVGFDSDDCLPLGAVIATVRLAGWLRIDGNDGWGRVSGWLHRADGRAPSRESVAIHPTGDYSPGRYVWLVDQIRVLSEPVPVRGWQGFWNWQV